LILIASDNRFHAIGYRYNELFTLFLFPSRDITYNQLELLLGYFDCTIIALLWR